ncbi:MAG: translation initiation factor [Bacteroidales bacterium]|nr:translation initiation factor [Bacteroidales bacterium]
MKDWKDRLGVVFSTDPDYQYKTDRIEESETLSPEEQILKITTDCKHRKGKIVTLVSGFTGKDNDLKDLGKLLKTKCGTGGSVKAGDIIIQGDFREKIKKILSDLGYNTK